MNNRMSVIGFVMSLILLIACILGLYFVNNYDFSEVYDGRTLSIKRIKPKDAESQSTIIRNETLAKEISDFFKKSPVVLSDDVAKAIDSTKEDLSSLFPVGDDSSKVADSADKALDEPLNKELERLKESSYIKAKQILDDAEKEAKNRSSLIIREAEEKRDKLLSEAKIEGDRIISNAKTQGDEIISSAKSQSTEIVLSARTQSDEIVNVAKKESDDILQRAEKEKSEIISDAMSKGDTIVSNAKSESSTIISDAKNESEKIVKDAKNQSNTILSEAASERDRIISQGTSDLTLLTGVKESDELVLKARQESDKIISEARQKQEEILSNARKEGEKILDDARNQKEKLISEAIQERDVISSENLEKSSSGKKSSADVVKAYKDKASSVGNNVLSVAKESVSKAGDLASNVYDKTKDWLKGLWSWLTPKVKEVKVVEKTVEVVDTTASDKLKSEAAKLLDDAKNERIRIVNEANERSEEIITTANTTSTRIIDNANSEYNRIISSANFEKDRILSDARERSNQIIANSENVFKSTNETTVITEKKKLTEDELKNPPKVEFSGSGVSTAVVILNDIFRNDLYSSETTEKSESTFTYTSNDYSKYLASTAPSAPLVISARVIPVNKMDGEVSTEIKSSYDTDTKSKTITDTESRKDSTSQVKSQTKTEETVKAETKTEQTTVKKDDKPSTQKSQLIEENEVIVSQPKDNSSKTESYNETETYTETTTITRSDSSQSKPRKADAINETEVLRDDVVVVPSSDSSSKSKTTTQSYTTTETIKNSSSSTESRQIVDRSNASTSPFAPVFDPFAEDEDYITENEKSYDNIRDGYRREAVYRVLPFMFTDSEKSTAEDYFKK